MELIPILSTIILVATISTFILAIGAYILYKVRERSGRVLEAPEPGFERAELITPAAVPQPEAGMPQPVFAEEAAASQRAAARQPAVVRTPQRFTPMREAGGGQPGQFPGAVHAARGKEIKGGKETKFLKYTSEGYIPTVEDKVSGGVKWR